MQEFQLKITPLQDNSFAVELYQCAYKKAGEKKRPSPKKIAIIKGNSLILIKQTIYQVLKANKYAPQTLNYKRKTPYILTEESGIYLAILFQTIKPLKKEEKIINIRDQIIAMSYEEARYWFAKINHGKRNVTLRALRILLGES